MRQRQPPTRTFARAAAVLLTATLTGCGGEGGGLGGTGAGGATRTASASSPADGVTVFREHHLRDPGLGGMVASTLLVPEDWQLEGGLQRTASAFFNMPVLADVRVEAPDGRAVRFFPSMNFSFGGLMQGQARAPMDPTLNGNPYLPLPDSVGAFVLDLASSSPDPDVSDLRVVLEEDVPDLTRQLHERYAPRFREIQQNNRMWAGVGVSMDFDVRATRLVLSYRDQGQPMEETLLVVWQALLNLTHGQVTQGAWSIDTMRSMRGPAGSAYLQDPVLAAIVRSVRVNPAWMGEMRRYWDEIARIQHRGRMERQRSFAAAQRELSQTYSEIGDIISDGWSSRSEIADRSQAELVDSIHERTPYATPTGETVELPSFWDNAYTDGDGRYLLHNDALWDPNTDRSFNHRDWQRIEPVRR